MRTVGIGPCRAFADQLADRQANCMRQIFKRIDVEIVGAAGQEGTERRPIVYVDNGAGVPVRVVAVNHDTSIVMIERTYSRHIGDHADAIARAALLDTAEPIAGTVPSIRA